MVEEEIRTENDNPIYFLILPFLKLWWRMKLTVLHDGIIPSRFKKEGSLWKTKAWVSSRLSKIERGNGGRQISDS